MRKLTLVFAAAAALLAPGLGAQAQPVNTQILNGQVLNGQAQNPLVALQKGDLQTDYSQWRGYRGGPRGAYGPRGYYGRPAYGRPYYGRPYGGYYRRDNGAAVAAGVAGLATGAIIGGAIASQQQAQPVYQAPAGNV